MGIELLKIAASHFRCWPPLWIDIDVDRMDGTLKFWSCVAMSEWRERTDNLLSKIPSELNANFFNVGNDRYIGYILVIHSHPRGPALKSVIISGGELDESDLDSDPKTRFTGRRVCISPLHPIVAIPLFLLFVLC